MSLTPSRLLRSLSIGLLILSCAPEHILGPTLDPSGFRLNVAGSSQSVVISQVYGGGGNSGALYKNDFIEVFNNGSDAVDVTGWSVQYASTSGTTWQKTNLPAGTLAAGHYLLIQESLGAGGSLSLPTPDATGTIAMAAGAGKVALVRNTTLLSCGTAALPCTSSAIADFVGYGSGTTYFEGTGVAPTLSNTTADARKSGGCTDSNDNAADFTAVTLTATGSTVPRNSATAANVCVPVANPVDHITVAPATATIAYHGTQTFTAHVFDATNVDITATTPVTWSSSATSVATVVSTGTNPATALATSVSFGDANIVASAGGKSGQGALHVNLPPPPPTVHFSELHYDNSGTDVNEKIEIEGPAGTDLTGWSVVLYGGDAVPDFSAYSTTTLGVQIPATCNTKGVVVISYDVNGIKNAKFNGTGNPAGMALVDNTNHVVEFLSYEGTFTALDGPAAGIFSTDMGVAEEPPPAPGNSLHRDSNGIWQAPAAQDFGLCNGTGGTPPPSTNTISFSGRLVTDPALPVGFEDQLFGTEHDGATNATISTSFTWSSDTPGIATIDADGVMRGVSDGNAIFRATATDGTTATYTLPVATNVFSGTADWSGNTEFGVPTDNDPSDDFIITHPQFTSSYSLARNIPNWVSAKLDISHYGTNSDRCDCFTFDPAVPANLYYTTNAYTGVGSTWNRGHLLRSADVESSTGDNAFAYYFSNIAPQSAQMNQVTWAGEENYLGNLAKTGGMDVYEIMGVSGSQGTLKNEGKVTIPAQFWKVAVIVPHGRKLADIHSYTDLQVIAVIIPNIANPNSDWNFYKTTVHAVETLSGYNLLSALPDDIELLVENNDRPPTAVMSGPTTGTEGATLAFDGTGSTDPDGDALTYTWNFNDGGTATGANPTHTFTDNGTFNVTLTVADPIGATSTSTQVVTISNVAPTGTFTTPGPTNEGETFALSISAVTDPSSADVSAGFSYRFDCGTGFGSWTSSASANCLATDNPGYSVAGEVRDKDGGVSSHTGTVVVSNVAPSALFGNNGPVNEGTGFTLTLANGTDPGTADVSAGLQYRFDCGSGFGSWAFTNTAFCPAPDNGTFAVAGEVRDKDGGVSTYTGSAVVLNVAPTATFSNNGPVDEGSSFTLSLSNPLDPSMADVAAGFQYRFDCGTGFGSWTSSSSANCPATDNGTVATAGEVRDKDGGVSSYQGSVTVNNVAPTATFGNNGPVNEGSGFTLSLSNPIDPSAADVAAGFQYRFDCGTGFGSWSTSATATCPTTDNGTLAVAGEIRDKDGGTSGYTGSVVVLNVAPAATFSNSGPVTEGNSFTLSLSNPTDPSGADVAAGFQYRFDCGSGFGSWSTSPTATCPTTDNGSFAVAGQIRDKDGGVSSYAGAASVSNVAPTATFGNNGPVNEGGNFLLSLSGGSDVSSADIAAGLQYRFDCGAGFGAWGAATSASCPANNDGDYHVAGEIRDKDNGVSSYTGDAIVNNVAPAIGAFSGASLLPGETYSANGSFTDPGADSWTATVNYGDGSGTGSLGLSGKSFSLSHKYTAAGSFTVTVGVSDGEVTSTQTSSVNVESVSRGVQDAAAVVAQLLSAGKINSGNANSLQAKLGAAADQIGRGNTNAATNQLQSLLNELDAMVSSGRLSSADASALRTLVTRVITSLSA